MKKISKIKIPHKHLLGNIFLITIIVFWTNLTFADESFNKAFPQGEGSDTVTRNCTGCHSSKTVLQNRLTRERWDEAITVMQEKHGLWDLDLATRNQILNYLSTVRGLSEKKSAKKTFKPYRFEYRPNPLQ